MSINKQLKPVGSQVAGRQIISKGKYKARGKHSGLEPAISCEFLLLDKGGVGRELLRIEPIGTVRRPVVEWFSSKP